MKKKARTSSPQSSFLRTVDKLEYGENTIPERAKIEVVTKYLTFPKIVTGLAKCPDCGSPAILRPDGSMVCPKCTVKIQCGEAK